MGPIEFASGLIMGNQIQKAIEELGPEGLREAYWRGVADVAKLAGVQRDEVARIVPAAEVAKLEARLKASHPGASAAWRLHAGQFGFLDVVTALTIDGRRPDIRTCLERVAGKVRQDRALAKPLESLSVDVAEWTELVALTCRQIEDLQWLTNALRRRVVKRAVFSIIVVTLLVGITSGIVAVQIAHRNVTRRIEAASECDAERFTVDDLKWADEKDRARVKEKAAACAAERERVAEERRQEEARAAEERRAREALEARLAACASLAASVDGGSLSDADKTTAGDSSGLLERIAKKTLSVADAGPIDPSFPCADSPTAHQRIETAYGAALIHDTALWSQKADLSPYAQKALIASKGSLNKNVIVAFASTADRTAETGVTGGDKKVIERAKRLCLFAQALGMPRSRNCNTVARL